MDLRFQLETLIKSKNEAVRRYEELVKSTNQTRLEDDSTDALELESGSQSFNAGLNLMSLPPNQTQPAQGNTKMKSPACETNAAEKNGENHDLNKGLTEALADCHRATLGFLECLHIVLNQWKAVQKYNAEEVWIKFRLTVEAMQALRVVQPTSSKNDTRLYSGLVQLGPKQIIEQWKEEHEATKHLFPQTRSQDSASPSESAQSPQTGDPKAKRGKARTEGAAESEQERERERECEREREREREDQHYQETARCDDLERKPRGPNPNNDDLYDTYRNRDVYRNAGRGLGFASEKGGEPPKPSQPEYRPKRDEATSSLREFKLQRGSYVENSARNLDADEDYRRRLEQVSKELGRSAASYRSETPDPDRERRKREREARLRERKIRREPKLDAGASPTPFVYHEPPPVIHREFNCISDSGPSAGSASGYGDSLRRQPIILNRPIQYNEPQAQIIDNTQSERRETRVRIIEPPTEEEDRRPKGILKKPTEGFPRYKDAVREGVAPLKDADSFNSGQGEIIDPPLMRPDADPEDTEDPVDALLREWTTVQAC